MTTPILQEINKYESDQLDQLYSALAKAQGEMEIALTDSVNPFFKSKYSDFTSIVKASRQYLSKNGLSVIQRVMTDDKSTMFLNTRLCHMSGQWIESKMIINPVKNDIQSIGSYITYLKRYNLASIVGVATDDANDDDGEKAMSRDDKKEKNLKDINDSNDFISRDKERHLLDLIKKLPEDIQIDESDKVLSFYKVNEMKEIRNKDFVGVNKMINNLILKYKGK
jgi:hypothetical protein